jgi:hypothetical protein
MSIPGMDSQKEEGNPWQSKKDEGKKQDGSMQWKKEYNHLCNGHAVFVVRTCNTTIWIIIFPFHKLWKLSLIIINPVVCQKEKWTYQRPDQLCINPPSSCLSNVKTWKIINPVAYQKQLWKRTWTYQHHPPKKHPWPGRILESYQPLFNVFINLWACCLPAFW